MNLLDYAVLVILGFSILLSVIRGLVREYSRWLHGRSRSSSHICSVRTWLCSCRRNSAMNWRWLAGFASLFFLVLLAMSLVALAVSQLVKSAGLSVEDRILGAIFGLARRGGRSDPGVGGGGRRRCRCSRSGVKPR